MAKILVTGSAGFIGSHLSEYLLREGHRVIGIDNFRTGSRKNLETALRSARFRLIEADLAAGAQAQKIVRAVKPDAIIHLAALVGVQESFAHPAENFRLNVKMPQLLVDAAGANGVRRIVFASSAAVYGHAGRLPIREDSAVRPASPYGAAKLAAEALLLGGGAARGATVKCLRFFNVYGPRQNPGSPYSGVISRFCEKLSAGERPAIYGDGRQTRDFVFVGDVARACALAATRTGLRSGICNVCSGRAISLNQLCAFLGGVLGARVKAKYSPSRPGDIRHSCGNPTQAKRELGFSARISAEEGLRSVLHHQGAGRALGC